MSLAFQSKQQILDTMEYRWPRLCLDQRFWEHPKVLNDNPFNLWRQIKFERSNYNALTSLDGQQGIYMFVVKPSNPFCDQHSYPVYVGETDNLHKRFQTYFTYHNTHHPSDQFKRRMVIVWENFLYFHYYPTNYANKAIRRNAEFDLIDCIVPPINDAFRSKVLSAQKKALRF